jgi:hypothetical protein
LDLIGLNGLTPLFHFLLIIENLKREGNILVEALLLEWGTEIILSLVIAYLTYYFKKSDKEKDK